MAAWKTRRLKARESEPDAARRGSRLRWMLGVTLTGLSLAARSGASLQLQPVTLTLDPTGRSSQLTIINHATTPTTLQIRLFDWQQTPESNESLQPTTAILLNPSMLRIEAGATQIVRLALRKEEGVAALQSERAFRLILDEVPDAAPAQNGVSAEPDPTVGIRMRYSLPVFSGGRRPAYTGSPPLKLTGSGRGETCRIEVDNPGDRHVVLSQVAIQTAHERAEQPIHLYVLAHSQIQFPCPPLSAQAGQLQAVRLQTGDGPVGESVAGSGDPPGE